VRERGRAPHALVALSGRGHQTALVAAKNAESTPCARARAILARRSSPTDVAIKPHWSPWRMARCIPRASASSSSGRPLRFSAWRRRRRTPRRPYYVACRIPVRAQQPRLGQVTCLSWSDSPPGATPTTSSTASRAAALLGPARARPRSCPRASTVLGGRRTPRARRRDAPRAHACRFRPGVPLASATEETGCCTLGQVMCADVRGGRQLRQRGAFSGSEAGESARPHPTWY
jgi:hypothetical protein